MTKKEEPTFAFEAITMGPVPATLTYEDLTAHGQHVFDTLSDSEGPVSIKKVLSGIKAERPLSQEERYRAYEEVLALGGLQIILSYPFPKGKAKMSPSIELVRMDTGQGLAP